MPTPVVLPGVDLNYSWCPPAWTAAHGELAELSACFCFGSHIHAMCDKHVRNYSFSRDRVLLRQIWTTRYKENKVEACPLTVGGRKKKILVQSFFVFFYF